MYMWDLCKKISYEKWGGWQKCSIEAEEGAVKFSG